MKYAIYADPGKPRHKPSLVRACKMKSRISVYATFTGHGWEQPRLFDMHSSNVPLYIGSQFSMHFIQTCNAHLFRLGMHMY